jgi:hypothetical protein
MELVYQFLGMSATVIATCLVMVKIGYGWGFKKGIEKHLPKKDHSKNHNLRNNSNTN